MQEVNFSEMYEKKLEELRCVDTRRWEQQTKTGPTQ
jgi:hypothetical protein